MEGRILLCLLGVALLAHVITAYPSRNSIDSTNDKDITSNADLLQFAEKRYEEIAEWLVVETAKLYEKTLANARELRGIDLTGPIAQMTAYVEHVKELERSHSADKQAKILQLSEECHEFEHKFQNPAKTDAAATQMERLLKDNGIDSLDMEFARRFVRLSNDIEEKVKQYVSQMTTAQRERESKLVKWYNDLKNETVADKKFDLIMDFLEVINQ